MKVQQDMIDAAAPFKCKVAVPEALLHEKLDFNFALMALEECKELGWEECGVALGQAGVAIFYRRTKSAIITPGSLQQ